MKRIFALMLVVAALLAVAASGAFAADGRPVTIESSKGKKL